MNVARLPPRTLYAEKRGCAPAKAVEALRVDAARRPLEDTDDRIESIAEDYGFSNEEQMHCASSGF